MISMPVLVCKVSRVQGAVKRSHVSHCEFLVAVRREFEHSCVSCRVQASELKLFAFAVTISLDGFEHFELEQLYF